MYIHVTIWTELGKVLGSWPHHNALCMHCQPMSKLRNPSPSGRQISTPTKKNSAVPGRQYQNSRSKNMVPFSKTRKLDAVRTWYQVIVFILQFDVSSRPDIKFTGMKEGHGE